MKEGIVYSPKLSMRRNSSIFSISESFSFPKTQIIKKNVEDFRDYNRDYLGKSNNLA